MSNPKPGQESRSAAVLQSGVTSRLPGARSVADDEDLAGGEKNSPAVEDGANVFTQQIQAIQKLRGRVAFVAFLVLCSLICAMGLTVVSFTKQIDKATPEVKLEKLPVSTQGAATPVEQASSNANELTSAVKTTTKPSEDSTPTVASGTVTSVLVDISSIGNSVVAVIAVLVLSITVLSIALLRSTFTLAAHRESTGGSSDSDKKSEGDSSVQLPAVEALKAGFEALQEVVKGLSGKKD